jgi:phosphoribosylanthranilate isomerase
MWVKICANTNLQDAALAAELGADAVGFVFVPSKRRVTAEQVAAITPGLPSSLEKVGVFHSQDAEEVISAVHAAGVTTVQLHASFDLALVEKIIAAFEGRVKVIQTVRCEVGGESATFEDTLAEVLQQPSVWAVLLDAAKAGVSGGLGVTFDWDNVAPMVQHAYARATELCGEDLPKLIVAGGLNQENVAEAIAKLQPWGVDVASGVEASPGVKDPARLRAFINTARASR